MSLEDRAADRIMAALTEMTPNSWTWSKREIIYSAWKDIVRNVIKDELETISKNLGKMTRHLMCSPDPLKSPAEVVEWVNGVNYAMDAFKKKE